MEKFIVSARKYRPNNFLSLVGQDSIAVTLKNSIQRGQLAHAYLFCGPRGVGKTSTARIFAKTINCMNPGADLEPCGECESCISFAQGRSYCIHELDAASNNSVDDIRLLTEKVMIPPQIGKYSVYIIDEVHMLSSAAFNAFLKTLEEPPAHAIFILATTEKHKILPTILSRCQTYDFNRISIEDIVKNLASIAKKEEITIDTDSLHVIAQKADGAMRDALTLFDQCVAFCGTQIEYSAVIRNLNVLDHEYYFNIVESALAGNFSRQLLLFDEVLSKGFNALYFIGGLGNHLRNLLVCKDTSTLKLLEMAPAVAERYKAQSAKCSVKFLYEALGNTTKCESEYRQSSNQRLLVEFLLVKLAQLAGQPQALMAEPLQQPAFAAQAQKLPAAEETRPQQVTPAQEKIPVQQPAPPQPAVEHPHQKEPAPQRPKAVAGGLSIKNIMKQAQSAPKAAEQELVDATEPVTIEKLNAVWGKMADTQSQYPRLASAIRQTAPELRDNNTTVVFKVGNSAQQSWIEKNSLPVLTGFLQRELRNGGIKLVVEVIEVAQQERKPYTPYEKADRLRKNYPELVNLEKDLDLDIK
ncbi:MAG: DNA polymerase III subunit gamma/tau [Bacteroidales bacterium]|nr:DNA polymerase III subunit gamma/tau [Bacteroidales bacterium]